MDELTSTRNPRVRAAAALARRKERRERGLHLVEGPNAVAEALHEGVVDEVFCTPDRRDQVEVPAGVTVTVVAEHVLATVADAATPQGIVAVARSVTSPLAAVTGRGVLLVLDALADPGNVGTTVRTADAAGATAVVLTRGCADVFGPKAVRAAAGSTYHLPLVTDVRFDEVVAAVRGAGQALWGMAADGQRSVFDLAVDGPVALVLGSEAHGLSAAGVLDGTLHVPMVGRAESLNVAAAGAIALYAVTRAVAAGPGR